MAKQKLGDRMNSVHRAAVMIKPLQPYINWLNSLGARDNESAAQAFAHVEVYLLPDFEEDAQVQRWLKTYYDWIFAERLNSWSLDEETWPAKRTYKMFCEWFDVSYCTMVWDTVDGAIEKE